MSETEATPQVQHDSQRQAFVLSSEGDEVLLRYRRPDSGSIEFYSTYTPESLRGRGLARVVVDAGLAYAEAEHLKVIPSCSYVAKVVERRAH